ncbi:DUF3040 domain-containing protein [Symbioplanes lichenis]|uniref:DUF3040 domain-containing protein n=1 Tax=Symbioplanes lichenis TaxID=1629072 RepID=UPI0027388AAE|nr:DUF3040 domain-containing protein [Actinoplanes lichenis]
MAQDPDDARRFDDIVARLHHEDPGFTSAFQEEPHRKPGRTRMLIGIGFCLVALGMLAFGGVKGAVLAVLPWLVGMACVLKGQG